MTLCFFNAKTTTTNQTAFFFFWFIMKYFAKVILLLRNLGPSCVKLLIKSQVENLVNKALIAELTPYHVQNASRFREKRFKRPMKKLSRVKIIVNALITNLKENKFIM